uniref:Theileria-specific sub-telomeric protein, putative n=1 Tax=Theileria annulata TaxID=5874 RepID=A0A3B0N4I9_THEAN
MTTTKTEEHLYRCPYNCKPAEEDRGNCPLLQAAYILAGLAMMLNIRLSYSSAPYALIRFRLPENLFSVFVRRMASSLEIWCLPGFIIADAIELAVKLVIKDSYKDNTRDSKKLKFNAIIVPSIFAQWLNFLTYVILFFVYLAGDDQGHLTTFYWTIAASGFVFGINNVFVFAADYNYIPIYIAGENCFPALTSFIHYITTLIFANRRKWDSDFLIVFIDILVAIIISLVAAIVWTWAYGFSRDASFDGKITTTPKEGTKILLTIEYKTTDGSKKEKTGAINKDAKNAEQIKQAIEETATCNDLPTGAETYYSVTDTKTKISYYFKLNKNQAAQLTAEKPIAEAPACIIVQYGHIFAEGFSGTYANQYMISPLLIVLVGMGLVYAIYPGIAPGMIVPFYLIDKIEMVLLIATIFPPVIIALLQRFKPNWSPKTEFLLHSGIYKFGGWELYNANKFDSKGVTKGDPVYGYLWHFFDLLMILMIILAYLFIYSLHYRDSNISRSIVNQPKMSTALTIIFYMCHEISLAVGFPGMVANAAEYTVIAQMVGAFLMVFLALYSEGYIIEYKSHDPQHWPTDGMWYLYGYYQLNPDFFIMIKFNVCSDG